MNVELVKKVKERLAKFMGYIHNCDHHQFMFHELDLVAKDIDELYQVEIGKEDRARRKRDRAK